MKSRIRDWIADATPSFGLGRDNQRLTALAVAEQFGIRRNTASYHLNQLAEEGTLFKINTRPVYYIDKAVFSSYFFPIHSDRYDSLEQLFSEEPAKGEGDDVLSTVVGAQGSLKKAVEQIQAAVLYPNGGLPVIFGGPTGVGKSYLAWMMYRFCVEKGVIAKDAPFLVFNCAQYYNNRELLSANLFGYVKGAFTGANRDHKGILAAADGGVLFLDEIHRLSPEGQEKLFTFMDQGVYRRMGESETAHKAKVRLTFATTESLEYALLDTFLRRIPVAIQLPPLSERSFEEKMQFLCTGLLEESQVCKKPIHVSQAALRAIQTYSFPGSVGELRSTVKYMCAKVYAHQPGGDALEIDLQSLPDQLLKSRSPGYKEEEGEGLTVRPQDTLLRLRESYDLARNLLRDMFRRLVSLHADWKKGSLGSGFFEDNMFYVIQSAVTRLRALREERGDLRGHQPLLAQLREFLAEAEREMGLYFQETCAASLVEYDLALQRRDSAPIPSSRRGLEELLLYLKGKRRKDGGRVEELVSRLEKYWKRELTVADRVFLTLCLDRCLIEVTGRPCALVVTRGGGAPGGGSAAIDFIRLPPDAAEEEMVAAIVRYCEREFLTAGLVVLADLLEPEKASRQIQGITKAPVALVNHVSLAGIRALGGLLETERSLERILPALLEQCQPRYHLIQPHASRDKAIITLCYSGQGTANGLQRLLVSSIPPELGIKITTCEYSSLKNEGADAPIFQVYDVLAIVGTIDPQVEGVDFISLEDLISGKGEGKIFDVLSGLADGETIHRINDNIVRSFSLQSVVSNLTILDTEVILENIGESIQTLEEITGKKLPNDKKITLYIHVSCMIERLIRQMPMKVYYGMEGMLEHQQQEMQTIRRALHILEERYRVELPDSEIGYILDILRIKSNISAEYL